VLSKLPEFPILQIAADEIKEKESWCNHLDPKQIPEKAFEEAKEELKDKLCLLGFQREPKLRLNLRKTRKIKDQTRDAVFR